MGESVRVNEQGQPIGAPLPHWTPPPVPPPVGMTGRYCEVRPMTAADAGPLWEMFALDRDGRNWTYLGHGPYDRYEDFARWAADASAGADPQFYAIEMPRSPKWGDDAAVSSADEPRAERAGLVPVGVASYMRIAPAAGSIEVGHIHYSLRLQRTPAATEAMFLMMRRAFELGYRRYEWKCDALNAPSRRAAQRFGFSFEGVFRQALVTKGRNRDTAWYACIDREWPALRAAYEQWLAPSNFDRDGRQIVSLASLTDPILVARG